jgi:hypothetical protein
MAKNNFFRANEVPLESAIIKKLMLQISPAMKPPPGA